MKLLENFKMGPKLIDAKFEILAYTDRVEIMMEECKKVYGLGKKDKEKLKKKVNILHCMGLIYNGFLSKSILYS